MAWFGRTARQQSAQAQARYAEIVAQARRPVYYTLGGAPDTLDGRFDMISLILALYLDALETAGGAGPDGLGAAVEGCFFADMDRGLRELGVGDLGVGKQVKRMAEAFYGRRAAYRAALADAGPDTLAAALARNVHRGESVATPCLSWLTARTQALAQALAAAEAGQLANGPLPFNMLEGENRP